MKRLLPVLMVFGVFLGSAGESFALPECPGSPSKVSSVMENWDNCVGEELNYAGSLYRGEWKSGKWHGKGISFGEGGSLNKGIFL